jgi:hypothetical protein
MGMLRCLSKPIKRYFFSYADKISDNWILIVSNKYVTKYIRKLNKDTTTESYDSSQYNHRIDLINFKNNLEYDLYKEKGLAHSKVREYWLRRGPRLLILLLITILITIGLAACLLDRSINDYIFSILVGINLILCSFYMLYQRLIDSISGAMMRIGHDHYTEWKNNKTAIDLQPINIPVHCLVI